MKAGTCETCKGTGKITLLISEVDCDCCGGTGRLIGKFEVAINGQVVAEGENRIALTGLDYPMEVTFWSECPTSGHSTHRTPDRRTLKTQEEFINFFQQFQGFRWSKGEVDFGSLARGVLSYPRFELVGTAWSERLYHPLTIAGYGEWEPVNEAIEKVINEKAV